LLFLLSLLSSSTGVPTGKAGKKCLVGSLDERAPWNFLDVSPAASTNLSVVDGCVACRFIIFHEMEARWACLSETDVEAQDPLNTQIQSRFTRSHQNSLTCFCGAVGSPCNNVSSLYSNPDFQKISNNSEYIYDNNRSMFVCNHPRFRCS
ncbi:hypothetical protein PFISCL1PPCAC_10926, partial [Pristionchus fissidentatus]